MSLPQSGQTLTGIDLYTYDASVNVGVLLGVQALTRDASNTTATFGTSGSNTTITINGTTYIATSVGGSESPTAFTFQAGGVTYLISNGPVSPTNVADVTLGNTTALIGGLGDIGVTPGAMDYVACYCSGTLILTERGQVPVEELAIGDQVITGSGRMEPVVWIGRRSYAGRFFARNPALQPVLFRAGALGDGLPSRDLRVSAKHAMFIDGMLIPAECLVNGTTIVRDGERDRVDYFHVELSRHDILLAEGVPSESFVDDDSRGMFQNAHEWEALQPAAERRAAVYCAPRVESGFVLEAIRRRLAHEAGSVVLAA